MLRGVTPGHGRSGGGKTMWISVARKVLRNGRVITYRLKHDDQGYYWDGLKCASWRRKTRASVDAAAERAGFDVIEMEVEDPRCEVHFIRDGVLQGIIEFDTRDLARPGSWVEDPFAIHADCEWHVRPSRFAGAGK